MGNQMASLGCLILERMWKLDIRGTALRSDVRTHGLCPHLWVCSTLERYPDATRGLELAILFGRSDGVGPCVRQCDSRMQARRGMERLGSAVRLMADGLCEGAGTVAATADRQATLCLPRDLRDQPPSTRAPGVERITHKQFGTETRGPSPFVTVGDASPLSLRGEAGRS